MINLLIYAAFSERRKADSMSDTDVTNKNMHPAERRAVSAIAVIGMLRMFGLFALLPVLALFAADLDGATPLLIGLAVGAYGLTQASLQIPLGALSDRIGRVPVILGGLAIFAAGSLLAASAETIEGVIAGRLLQGAGAISAALTALIADVTRESVRTRSMAVFGVGVGIAFLLAMVIGPLIAAHFGVRSLFVLGAVAAVLAALAILLIPGELRQRRKRQQFGLRNALRGDLLMLDLHIFLLHATLTASFVALPFVLSNRLNLPITEHWMVYVGAMLLSLPLTVPLIFKDDRQGKRFTISLAVSLLLFAELILAFLGMSLPAVFVALVLFFAGFNFLEAALPARVSILAGEGARGASLGFFATSQFFGAFVGGVLGGRFLGGGEPTPVFLVAVFLVLIWLSTQSVAGFRAKTA